MTQFSESEIAKVVLSLQEGDHVQGRLTAAIVLVEYGDYQCPESAQAHYFIKVIQKQLGENLCFVFRHFPQRHHPQAQRAAESAEAAAAQGKFWEMHDTLFEHQAALEDADILEYANYLGLDFCQFLRDLTEHVYAEQVQQNVAMGQCYGVKKAPAFFIRVCPNGQGLETLLMSILKGCTASE